MTNKQPVSFKDSLKSWDIENFLDRYFYRPIAFRIALLLKSTPVTPNAVTIFSIFVGVAACLLFYPDNQLLINLIGFALLVFANTLDCVDGQLARITGKKSQIGRILDGMTGDIWFLTFYLVMTFRWIHFGGASYWVFIITVLSALSHLYQAGMVDYYKTLHLHFLSGGKDSEFENTGAIQKKSEELSWKKDFIQKLFLKLYFYYTRNQEMYTPGLKKLISKLEEKHPEGYPEELIAGFRAKSLRLMPSLDAMTFNARSVVMLVTLLLNVEWLYFAIEILVLNPLLFVTIYRHEKMCRNIESKL